MDISLGHLPRVVSTLPYQEVVCYNRVKRWWLETRDP